jgi:hypothetical protein
VAAICGRREENDAFALCGRRDASTAPECAEAEVSGAKSTTARSTAATMMIVVHGQPLLAAGAASPGCGTTQSAAMQIAPLPRMISSPGP